MIIEDEKKGEGKITDPQVLKQFVLVYKFPLILTSIGILFLLLGVVYVVKTYNSVSEVVFTEATASAKSKILVDVAGAVMAPGVYQMNDGERISDALAIAGGLSADADREWVTKYLNKAAKLVDGGKIYIPSVTEVTSGQAQSSNVKTQNLDNLSSLSNLLGVSAGRININTASQSELESLPGVGPVTAGKIISVRPYQTIDELKSKKVVGNAVFEKIRDLITI